MSSTVSRFALICALVAVATACGSSSRSSRPASGPQPSVRTQPTVVVGSPAEDRRALGVPPGHVPAPGSCRLWYPGRPPGQQPRAGDCRTIMRDAPAATWVLYRPQNEPRYVHRREIDSRRPGVVVQVRVFEVNKGTYVRDERPGATDARQGQGSASQGSSSSSRGQGGASQQSSSNGKAVGKPDDAGKPESSGKSDATGKSASPGKSNDKDKAEDKSKAGDQEKGKPAEAGKSQGKGGEKEQDKGKSAEAGKSQKSQGKSDEQAEDTGKQPKGKSPDR